MNILIRFMKILNICLFLFIFLFFTEKSLHAYYGAFYNGYSYQPYSYGYNSWSQPYFYGYNWNQPYAYGYNNWSQPSYSYGYNWNQPYAYGYNNWSQPSYSYGNNWNQPYAYGSIYGIPLPKPSIDAPLNAFDYLYELFPWLNQYKVPSTPPFYHPLLDMYYD